MNRETRPCIIALEFAKKIIGSNHNITFDTQIYKLNGLYDVDKNDDLYTIYANKKKEDLFK